VFTLGAVFFLCAYLAQGLFISVATRSQQVSMQLAMLSGMLPANLLSGFIFPLASMPRFFWYLSFLLPARWFMDISRACFLRGSTIVDLAPAMIALSLYAAAMIAAAAGRLKRDLEP
jgi:ABC-2 type transport system permease protein